jgi:plasmid stabilization system protein ParE
MSENAYHVKVSIQAYYALNAHMEFLSRVNPDATGKQRREILAKIALLSRNPYLYPVFDADPDVPEYRKMVIGRYLILYVIDEDGKTVGVDLIWDTRMDNVL